MALRGIAASGGVAVGPAVVLDRRGPPVTRRYVPATCIDDEVRRLGEAVEASRREIEAVRQGLSADHQHDYGLILDAHMMMHRDELLLDSTVDTIRKLSINAEWALRRTVDELKHQLQATGPAYFRERAQDVEHVGRHILRHLTGAQANLPAGREPAILVADDLSPADAARLLGTEIRGVVVELGTATSHTAILARTLEIPAVVGTADVLRSVDAGDEVVVDGLRGQVIVHPPAEERDRAEARGERYRNFTGRLRAQRDEPSRTRDGVEVKLLANVELPAEAALAASEGAKGIGLYRTEFLYLDRGGFPDEEEQLAIYSDVVRVMAPRSVVFRTCDLGADKLPATAALAGSSPNPALGLRALRLSLRRPDLLEPQVRSILRAAAQGPAQIMLPLVTTVDEVRAARELIDRCCADLAERGIEHRRVPIGIMVEVPSAALMADVLARECDFFSVGTNDLVQYALALDRSNPEVAHLANALDPAVLKLLQLTAEAASAHELPLAMCGDMAADPVAMPIALGLGFRQLSMPVAYLALARGIVRRLNAGDALAVAQQALRCRDAEEVKRLVVEHFKQPLGDLWEEQGIEL